jgi:hypothetical protein
MVYPGEEVWGLWVRPEGLLAIRMEPELTR